MCSVEEPAHASPAQPINVFELASGLPLCNLLDVPRGVIHHVCRQASRLRDQQPQRPQKNSLQQMKAYQAEPLQAVVYQESEKQQLRLSQLHTAINPKGEGNNDRTKSERILNTLTSLPIIFVGLHTIKQRESTAGKQFGVSLLGVGLAATAYHASSGKLRRHLRKLDYWSISLCTSAAVRAALPAKSQERARLSSIGLLALAPFQPSAVTAINASLTQVEFAKCSTKCPILKSAHRRQAATLAAGMACFGLEDMAIDRDIGFVHAMWHCLACYAVSSVNALISYKEQQMHS